MWEACAGGLKAMTSSSFLRIQIKSLVFHPLFQAYSAFSPLRWCNQWKWHLHLYLQLVARESIKGKGVKCRNWCLLLSISKKKKRESRERCIKQSQFQQKSRKHLWEFSFFKSVIISSTYSAGDKGSPPSHKTKDNSTGFHGTALVHLRQEIEALLSLRRDFTLGS